jgi:glucose/arabinose dehydrogenase
MTVKVESLESRRLMSVLPGGFAESLVDEGFESPTAMAVAPDGRIFVAEQAGRLRVIKNGDLLSMPFVTVNTTPLGERGLVGVELDPNFSSNGFVYVYYTNGSTTANRVSRFTANGDVAASGSERVLFQLDVTGGEASIHQGGAMHFGRDGKLYVATGDHGGRSRAQLLTNQFGKVLRLNPDGSIPTDNPFYDQTTGKNKAIWARGLRNPFTFGIQPGTGLMYINDVGENTWEEINQGRAGANYGWADSEGATSDPRFDGPVYAYHHTEGRAIVGGTFYNPPAGASAPFPSTYVGDYFFMDFDKRFVRRIDPSTKAVAGFATTLTGKPVDLDVGPDGSMYYLTRAVTDRNAAGVYRIRYTGSAAPSIGTHPSSRTVSVGQPATFSVAASGTGTLGYQWQRDGANISGATQSSYTLPSATLADSGATFRVVVTNSAGSATSNAATLTVTSNRAPTGTITGPASGTTYSGGSVINFAGTGGDPEDGTLPAGAFTWRVDFHHDSHNHPFMASTTGITNGSFTIPRDGELSANVWYRIHLTVKDSKGLTHSTFRDVKPVKATVTLAANVPGLKLNLDGQPVTSPHAVAGVAGITRSISAPATQVLDGTTYEFVAWSDGGAATHSLSFPSSNTTYTATYRATSGTVTKTLASVADAGVRDDPGGVNVNEGTAKELLVRTRPPGQLNRHAYFKFDLASLGNIASAKLRLFGRLVSTLAGESVTTGVFGADDKAWTETGLTWNNKPASGSTPLSTVTVATGAAKWYEFDVTDYLRQQKALGKTTVTLVIKNITMSKTSAAFRTREASSNRPELVVNG